MNKATNQLIDDLEMGNKCPRCADGKLSLVAGGSGSCTCFNNPPCSYCTDSYLECEFCGANNNPDGGDDD